MKTEIFTLIDILGTAAFSMSGVIAAMEKKLDFFGIFVIAFITAIGGGTVRDVIIGDLPVNWMRTGNYSVIIFLSAAVAILFYNIIKGYGKILLLFDSIGLGFFIPLSFLATSVAVEPESRIIVSPDSINSRHFIAMSSFLSRLSW